MGEQQRVATARALTVQETASALVATMDDRRDRLFVEDGAMALGLALATFVSVNATSPEHEQELLGRVVVTAQAGVRAAAEGAARRVAVTPDPVEVWGDDPWERSDWEPIRNDRTISAAQTVTRVYEFDCVGGNLHVTIDDENVNDGCLEGDAEWIERSDGHGMKQTDPARYARQQEAERACVAALRPLSEEERMSAIRIACRS